MAELHRAGAERGTALVNAEELSVACAGRPRMGLEAGYAQDLEKIDLLGSCLFRDVPTHGWRIPGSQPRASGVRSRDRQRPGAESLGDGLGGRRRCGRVSGQVTQGLRGGVRSRGGVEDRIAVGEAARDPFDEGGGEVAAARDSEGEPPLVELDQVFQRVLGGRGVVGDLPQHQGSHREAGELVEHLGVVAELGGAQKYLHGVRVFARMRMRCGVLGDGGHGGSCSCSCSCSCKKGKQYNERITNYF